MLMIALAMILSSAAQATAPLRTASPQEQDSADTKVDPKSAEEQAKDLEIDLQVPGEEKPPEGKVDDEHPWTVVEKLPVMTDPRALTLTADGSTLYVAGHRTGQPERYPYGTDPVDEAGDLLAIDTSTGAVLRAFGEVANVLTDLVLDESNNRLFVAATASYPERGLVTLSTPPFESQIITFDTSTGDRLSTHTLTPANEGDGYILGIQSLSLADGRLWAVAEGSEVALSFDTETLEERSRVSVEGGPRDILTVNDQTIVHASQAFAVQVLDGSGATIQSVAAGVDPRSPDAAAGQLHFIRPGEGYGANFSCNSCHLEGLGDTRVWQAGPLETWEASRPMMWLEGTAPLGWGAYVADVRTFGYTGFTSIINKWPESEDAEELGAYLSSFAPPPKANGWTKRDGGLSEAAERGKVVYDGKGQCAACHALPLTTSNASFDPGITEARSSTPILVGSYRHNAWLKTGEARTLEDAIQAALDWTDVNDLTESEFSDLTRYVRELTDRDFFVLSFETTLNRTLVGTGTPVELIFNQPIWDEASNVKKIQLKTQSGKKVKATVNVHGRKVQITPAKPLDQEKSYQVVVKAGLESFDQRTIPETTSFPFETAGPANIHFSGTYAFTAQIPGFNPMEGSFDESVSLGVTSDFEATPNQDGSDLLINLGKGLIWDTDTIISGNTFEIKDMPVSFGFSLAQGSAVKANASDSDGDGIIDSAMGTFTISGPGIFFEDREWTIVRKPDVDCPEGPAGDVEVEVSTNASGVPQISFEGEKAIGLYITDYGARLPLGPGTTVSDGNAYWAVETETFPTGFEGPVTYGVLPDGAIDNSIDNGAETGGTPLTSGQCYQFSVISAGFQTGSYTLVY